MCEAAQGAGTVARNDDQQDVWPALSWCSPGRGSPVRAAGDDIRGGVFTMAVRYVVGDTGEAGRFPDGVEGATSGGSHLRIRLRILLRFRLRIRLRIHC